MSGFIWTNGDVIYDRGEVDKVSRDGILLHVGISSTQLRNVESLQYEAARIVTGAWKSTSRDKIYAELEWESLQERRLIRRLSLIYETRNTKFPNYLHQILEKQSSPRLTNLGRYEEIPGGIAKVKLSFLTSTIRDWNGLAFDIKKSETKKQFKGTLNNKIRPKKKSYFSLRNNNKVRYLTMLRMEWNLAL